jgi:hypothetical protein
MAEEFSFSKLQEHGIYEIYMIETKNPNLEVNTDNILNFLDINIPNKFLEPMYKALNDRGLINFDGYSINITEFGLSYVEEEREKEGSEIFKFYDKFVSNESNESGPNFAVPSVGHNSAHVVDFSQYDAEIEDGLAKIDRAIEAIRGDNNIDTELKPSIISAIQSGAQHLRDRGRALLGAVREPILAGLTKGLEIATTTATAAALTGALTWATAFFAGLI